MLELVIIDLDNPVLNNVKKCEHKNTFIDSNKVTKLQATVKSELIQCEYFLKVSVDYDGTLISNKPVVEIPAVIYIPHVKQSIENYKPENWDPAEMPNMALDIPNAKQLGLYKGISTQSLDNFKERGQ